MDIKDYVTIAEAAKILGRSKEYVRRLVKSGDIPSDSSLGIVAIKRGDLNEQQRKNST